MLDALYARKTALRLELVELDALAHDYPGIDGFGLAGCHLQRAIDFLEGIPSVVSLIAADYLVQIVP